ncbi:TAXI family TRAP transporter solute-binding subunit [Neobacillus cucumis]|uniref:TAXI family TRAP transporter solute-binding subunit n=1 Tax=Bacillaceae TaxID=186817 RepID=UPI0015970460|nr:MULTISPECIES: TAXI family TRAP transporter solute-binding subunit [Bacillaceae]MCM3728882.1 TAXI family TRAP transporter solute-binding subunit [Neobacillus cucumis]
MKKFYQFVSILLVLILVLAGCGGKPTKEVSSKAKTSSKGDIKVTIAGGSAGGLWSTIGEGLGESIKRSYPNSTFTYQPGQDGANIMTVMTGQAEFGIVSASAAKWAYKGEKPYTSKMDKVRTVAYLHSMPYHFAVSEDSGISSIEQIVKEKMPLVAAVNTKNSPMEISNRVVFKSYGSSYEQIEKNGGKIQYLAVSKANDQIKDNKMDGSLSPLPTPAGNLIELNTSKPMKILPLSDKAIKAMEKELAAKPYTIKAGTYPFVKKDIPTAAVDTILVTSADVPDDVVYKVTKAIYEHLDYLYTVHKSFEAVTKDTIADVQGAPMHPGAEKFYKEAGILKK